jgi:hypothetical protein
MSKFRQKGDIMTKAEYYKLIKEQREYPNMIEKKEPGQNRRFHKGVCCSELKKTRGLRVRAGERVKIVWPEHLLEQYKRFMRACNPEFYNVVKDATIKDRLEICIDIPNGPTRFQCWCLWRCIWEMPKTAAAMLYLWTSKNKDKRLTPQMIQVVVAGSVDNWNHYMFMNCYPNDLKYTLSKLKNPPKQAEYTYFTCSELFNPGVGFKGKRIPTIDYLDKKAVSNLITQLGG